jgi:glutamine amidotransferase
VRVVVVDSGVGNVPNAIRGLRRAGADVTLSEEPEVVAAARCLVLPGVGAFPAAMARLAARGLGEAVRSAAQRGAAVLGICLGHQVLFESSAEFGSTPGLALLPGRVEALPPAVRAPHMGWSRLLPRRVDPLLAGMEDGAWMYFVHSFAAVPANRDVVATVDTGGSEVCAVARRGRVCGVQFHPEKSGASGARLLANFLAFAGDGAASRMPAPGGAG